MRVGEERLRLAAVLRGAPPLVVLPERGRARIHCTHSQQVYRIKMSELAKALVVWWMKTLSHVVKS